MKFTNVEELFELSNNQIDEYVNQLSTISATPLGHNTDRLILNEVFNARSTLVDLNRTLSTKTNFQPRIVFPIVKWHFDNGPELKAQCCEEVLNHSANKLDNNGSFCVADEIILLLTLKWWKERIQEKMQYMGV